MEKDMRFEDAMSALEDITRKLESGDLPLEDAIGAYERAVSLIKFVTISLRQQRRRLKY